MSSHSRESYAAASDRLGSLADTADAARLTAVGDEILSVADLLRREPRLRRALSDSARAEDDRVGLLSSVLAGKVAGETVDLLAALVAGRWSGPGDLLDATERLGVDAVLAGAERDGDLAEVEDELFRFGQIVDGHHALAAALADSSAALSRRTELVRDLLDSSRVRPATLRLAQLALAGFGGRGLSSSLTRLVELAAERRDRSVAYVTAAVALTDDDERRLAARLSELYGRQVSLKIDVDRRIIGGMRVKVGADLYDGTVARRLAEARAALTS